MYLYIYKYIYIHQSVYSYLAGCMNVASNTDSKGKARNTYIICIHIMAMDQYPSITVLG